MIRSLQKPVRSFSEQDDDDDETVTIGQNFICKIGLRGMAHRGQEYSGGPAAGCLTAQP